MAGGFALYRGWHFALAPDDERHAAGRAWPGGSLAAPMPGSVLRVDVGAGRRTLSAGEALVLLEAMKMELAVTAPGGRRGAAVHVRPGELVSGGQALVELEDE